MTALTERRATDRKIMAQMIIDTAIVHGCTATIDAEWSKHEPRAIMIRIEGPRGAHVSIDLDGATTQPDVHVWTWNIRHDSNARFGSGWGHDNVNPFHRRKASRVSYGIDALIATLATDCDGLVSGERFETPLQSFDTRYRVEQTPDGKWIVTDRHERKIEAGPFPSRNRAESVLQFMRQHVGVTVR